MKSTKVFIISIIIAVVVANPAMRVVNIDDITSFSTPGYDGEGGGGGGGGGGSGGGGSGEGGGGEGGGEGGGGEGGGGEGGGGEHGDGNWFDWWGTGGGAYYPEVGGGFGDDNNFACYYNYTLYNSTAVCQGALDVVFLIDSSTSISDADYKKEIDFVKKIVSGFYLHPNYTQVAILEFSTDVRTLQLLTYDACLIRKALETPRISGATNIAKAIETAHSILKGSRPDIPDQIILITDGYQTVSLSPNVNCEKQAHECNKFAIDAANRAKADEILIYTIGVGDASYYEEDLKQIASPPSDLYFSLATDYSKLNTLIDRIRNSTCPVVLHVLPELMCNEDMPKQIMLVGHGFPRSSSIQLLCQFGDFSATKAQVINQTHLLCDGPKLVDRQEWQWSHTANFLWDGESKVPIGLYYNGKSIVQQGVDFTYCSCPNYTYLIWVFLGVILMAIIFGVLAYIASHTKLEKKELPIRSKNDKPAAPPKPEHGGQIDLSMMEV